jgi:acylphosphatase
LSNTHVPQELTEKLAALSALDVRTRILISGMVQGVLFRREITRLSQRLGIVGWVRNLPDGRVETVAEGEKEKLDELIQFCRVGPVGARVKNIEISWSEYKGEFQGFKIVH